jgi:hypothetical protein
MNFQLAESIIHDFYFEGSERQNIIEKCERIQALSEEIILKEANHIFLQKPVISIDGNDVFILNIIDDIVGQFYIEIYLTKCFIPEYSKECDVIRLFSIWIPEQLRRRQLCTKILDILEIYTQNCNKIFVIGPVIEDEMIILLNNRNNFKKRCAFDFYSFDEKRLL